MGKSPSESQNQSVVSPDHAKSVRAPKTKTQANVSNSAFSLIVFFVLVGTICVAVYFLLSGPFSNIINAFLPVRASQEHSYIFAYPLTIRADTTSTSTIDVFVASNKSMPLWGRKVEVRTTSGTVKPNILSTDTTGHAKYTLTMTEPGIATISVSVDNVLFSKIVHVTGE